LDLIYRFLKCSPTYYQGSTGYPVPVPANPATFKISGSGPVPAKNPNIDRIEPDFILLSKQPKSCNNPVFFHFNILLRASF